MSQPSELLHQLVASANGRVLLITQNDFPVSIHAVIAFHIFALLVDSILSVRLQYILLETSDFDTQTGPLNLDSFFFLYESESTRYATVQCILVYLYLSGELICISGVNC